MTDEERWEDYEWQFRRRLANMLSQRLAMKGLAARTLAVHFTGQIKKGHRGPYRSGSRVVININEYRIATNSSPYLPEDLFLEKQRSALREAKIRKMLHERREEIIVEAINKYRSILINSPELRKYAVEGLTSVFTRMGISLR